MNQPCSLSRTVLFVTILAFGLGAAAESCPAQRRITAPSCSCSELQREDCAGCRAFRRQMESGIAPSVPSDTVPDVQVPIDDPTAPIESPSDALPPQFDQTPPDVQQALSPARPSANQFASAFGATNAGAGIPGMLGDFCGLSPRLGSDSAVPGFATGESVAPVAGGNCRQKFAEFSSPCPQDRVIFMFQHYENGAVDVLGDRGNIDLVTLGIEKTILRGLASVEVRVPFLSGLQSDVGFGPDTFGSEFGNVSTTLKVLLTGKQRYAVSTGTTFIWPTGDDADFFGSRVENEAIHAAPFVAWMLRPGCRAFHQAVVQVDFDLSGDTVSAGNGATDNVKNQTLLYLDYSLGYWLFQNRRAPIRSMATLLELHYTSTLNDVDLTPVGER